MKRLLLTIAGIVMALGVSQAAQADTFFFTSCHVTGGCTGTSFGSVTLTQNGSNVDVVVTLAAGEQFIDTGAGDEQYFKFNDTSSGTTTVTENSSAIQFNVSDPLGSFCGDSGGCFAYGIGPQGAPSGNTPITGPLVFTINNTTIANLTTLNNLGQIFVADVIFTGTGNTGLVDVSTGGTVPDGGSTAMLLGSALLGLGALRRRFGR
jgi:hypothetical protein